MLGLYVELYVPESRPLWSSRDKDLCMLMGLLVVLCLGLLIVLYLGLFVVLQLGLCVVSCCVLFLPESRPLGSSQDEDLILKLKLCAVSELGLCVVSRLGLCVIS